MTAVALTATEIAPCMNDNPVIVDVLLAETVTKGQIGYQTTSGTFGVADANDSGKEQARGVFLKGGGAGQTVSMLIRGRCYGFTVSSLNGDAVLYLSDTAGALDTSTGSLTVVCGRVTTLTNGTKVAALDFQWSTIWA